MVIVKPNPADPCCPMYECEPSTTPPSVTTTKEICKNVECPIIKCDKIGYTLVAILGSDPCCYQYSCVPEEEVTTIMPTTSKIYTQYRCENVKCPEDITCRPGETITVKSNAVEPCCPLYECESPTTTPAIGIETSSSPLDICKNVRCQVVTCEKEGASIVVVPWVDPCCPHFVCECQTECSRPPTCTDRSQPIISIDPETQCCPTYTCEPSTTPASVTTTKEICKNVTCPIMKCDKIGYTLVATLGSDPCCSEYSCVPEEEITTMMPTTSKIYTQPGCEYVKCSRDTTCRPGEMVIVKSNPADPCCPMYECESVLTTTPAIGTETSTSPLEICKNVQCYPVTCEKEGAFPVGVAGTDPCCPEFDCECQQTCSPAPFCGIGVKPDMSLDPETQCCPTYKCRNEGKPVTTPSVIVTTTQPTTTGETQRTTGSIVSSTKPNCRDVICSNKKPCKDNERVIVKPNPLNPCCPLYECECTCKTVPACSSDERLVAVQQNNQCCPRLKCERKRDECNPVPKEVQLTSGKCSASVILQVCSGYCQSSTEYSSLWKPVSQCRCCSVTTTRPKNFELPCLDGTRARLTVQEALQCGCNRCSGSEEEGSGEQSGDGSGEGSEDEASGDQMWTTFEESNKN
ncbi:hypothetical protein FKM82_013352 [Ascaphus truei]